MSENMIEMSAFLLELKSNTLIIMLLKVLHSEVSWQLIHQTQRMTRKAFCGVLRFRVFSDMPRHSKCPF